MTAVPRIADVQCSRLVFQPGDCLLVKVYQPLDRESLKKLQKSIQKWAGDYVEVLIVDTTRLDISLEREGKTVESIVKPY